MKKKIIKKKFKITLLVLLLISIFSYVSCFVVLYNSNYKLSNYKEEFRKVFGSDVSDNLFDFSNWNSSHYFSDTSGYAIDSNIKTLHIKTVSSNISLKSYDSSHFNANYSGNSSKPNETVSDGFVFDKKDTTLNISMNDAEKKIYNGNIEISIPNKFNGNIIIDTVSGNINLDGINASNLTVKSTSSDVILRDSNISDKLDITSTSGTISLYSQTKFKNAKFKTVSGDINTDLSNNINSLDITSTSGDVILSDVNTMNNVKFDLNTTSGDINHNNINLEKGTENSKVKVTTISGDIDLN
ncbi:DUF4097 family beta strand repeat-containing protein [Clostridium baratii]|uniref:DUF4097 family beta strand repeat-containing protein n=1 Tax=Clostridium baratii TaxID=1561 RepID=UPI0006BB42ED|nr:DUF4097 family beta strand repeat-containing protein [Clostridium baratii]